MTACGGGGSGANPATPKTPGAAYVPPDSNVVVQGTVATGHAWASAQLTALCTTGRWSTASDDAGRYQLALQANALPCLLRAQNSDGTQTMYSAALPGTAASGQGVANVTPLTDLVLARMLARNVEPEFASGASLGVASVLTAERAAQAQLEVSQMLASVATLRPADSVFTTRFAAATASQPDAGDSHDRLLDTLANSIPRNMWLKLRDQAASSEALPILANSASAGAAPRVFVLPQPLRVDNLPDTNPSTLRSEPAMAFWPMVARDNRIRSLEFGPLSADEIPNDVWSVRFQSWEWSNGIGARSGYRNDGACSLSKVGDSLVATVGGKTWSAQMNGPSDFAMRNGWPTNDALGVSISYRTVVQRAVTRYLEIYAHNSATMVHPVNGAFDGGTTITVSVLYDPLDANNGASATMDVTEYVVNTDPNTKSAYPFLSQQYRCMDRDYTSNGNTGDIPADSTLP